MGEENWVLSAGDDSNNVWALVPTTDLQDVEWRAGNDTNDVLLWREAEPSGWTEDWHHFGFVKDEGAGTMSIYFDGVLAKSKTGVCQTLSYVGNRWFKVGAPWDENDGINGKLDNLRIYDRALSDNEIATLFRAGDLGVPWAPNPLDGAVDVPWDVNLAWSEGDWAGSHDVYFGTDWDDVNDANTTVTLGVYKGSREVPEYDPPGNLLLTQTYYWRIDEINEPNNWKGPVWRFTVADFLILDDFERYDSGDNRIYYTWYDQRSQEWLEATGSWLGLATEPTYPVHTGKQAMSYQYDTDDPWADLYYAEAWLPLDEIGGRQDWTTAEVRLLTLFFYGDAGNDANQTEQMYVGVEDTAGDYAEMRYGEHTGEALSDLKIEEWQRWDVPFVWFADSNAAVPNDVNFANVRRVYIGFGNRRNPAAGGEGVVYFDDLRVSMPICKPEYGPTGDLSGDCFVGVGDIGAMGDHWLRHDINCNPVTPPSDANLVAHWKLDGDATDSSANAYHGIAEGSYAWVAGKDGQAIDLSGGWVVVDDNGVTPKLRPNHYVSVMAWIYLEEAGKMRVVIKGRDDNETFGLEVGGDGVAFIIRDANDPNNEVLSVKCGYELWQDEWIHVAGTYDQNEQICYVNGEAAASETRGAVELLTDANDGLGIGGRYGDTSNRFNGKIDDVRVYDRAVTRAEIAYMASGGDGLIPLESEANLYSGEDPEVINFKDFARLFDYWGDEQLWPPEPAP